MKPKHNGLETVFDYPLSYILCILHTSDQLNELSIRSKGNVLDLNLTRKQNIHVINLISYFNHTNVDQSSQNNSVIATILGNDKKEMSIRKEIMYPGLMQMLPFFRKNHPLPKASIGSIYPIYTISLMLITGDSVLTI